MKYQTRIMDYKQTDIIVSLSRSTVIGGPIKIMKARRINYRSILRKKKIKKIFG